MKKFPKLIFEQTYANAFDVAFRLGNTKGFAVSQLRKSPTQNVLLLIKPPKGKFIGQSENLQEFHGATKRRNSYLYSVQPIFTAEPRRMDYSIIIEIINTHANGWGISLPLGLLDTTSVLKWLSLGCLGQSGKDTRPPFLVMAFVSFQFFLLDCLKIGKIVYL